MTERCEFPDCKRPAEFEEDFVIGGDDLQPEMEEITVSLCMQHRDYLLKKSKMVSNERLSSW